MRSSVSSTTRTGQSVGIWNRSNNSSSLLEPPARATKNFLFAHGDGLPLRHIAWTMQPEGTIDRDFECLYRLITTNDPLVVNKHTTQVVLSGESPGAAARPRL
jgi:hypothetical protein